PPDPTSPATSPARYLASELLQADPFAGPSRRTENEATRIPDTCGWKPHRIASCRARACGGAPRPPIRSPGDQPRKLRRQAHRPPGRGDRVDRGRIGRAAADRTVGTDLNGSGGPPRRTQVPRTGPRGAGPTLRGS